MKKEKPSCVSWRASAALCIALLVAMPARAGVATTDTTFNGGVFTTDLGGTNDFGIGVTVGAGDRLYQLGAQCSGTDCRVGSTSGVANYVVSRNGKDAKFDSGFAVYFAPASLPFSGPLLQFEVDDGTASAFYVAGTVCTTACVIKLSRISMAGVVDTGYGVGGAATIVSGGTDNLFPTGIVLQPDGKLLIAGLHFDDSGGTAVQTSEFVGRFNPDGTADQSFGTNGFTGFTFGTCGDSGNVGLSLDPYTSNIYVTGETAPSCQGTVPAIVRLTPSGMLDATFGGDGRVVSNFSRGGPGVIDSRNLTTAFYATGKADGKVALLAGKTFESSLCPQLNVDRLNNDGTFDSTFSPGSVENYCPPIDIDGGGVTVQSSGKFVLNGVLLYQGGTSDEGMTRILGSTEFAHPIRTFQGEGPSPNQFAFDNQSSVQRSTPVISNAITVAGIGSPAGITVSRAQYRINGGAFTSDAGTVNNGDAVELRMTSSASYSTTLTSTLTIGSTFASFSVTTEAAPPPPPPPPPAPSSSGGGGSLGLMHLVLGIFGLWRRRVPRPE